MIKEPYAVEPTENERVKEPPAVEVVEIQQDADGKKRNRRKTRKSPACIEYHGIPGVTRDCLNAVLRLSSTVSLLRMSKFLRRAERLLVSTVCCSPTV
jgi:hypothetical protein